MKKMMIALTLAIILLAGCSSPSDGFSDGLNADEGELPQAELISEISDEETPMEESEESSEPEPEEDPEPELEPLTIDFDKLNEDLKEELTDPEFFGYVQDVSVVLRSDGSIGLAAVLDDSTDSEVAVDFADTLVRRCNALAQAQDSRIESPSNEYYGGLYDEYNLLVGIAPASKVDDSSAWYVYQAVTNGRYVEMELSKGYEEPIAEASSPVVQQETQQSAAPIAESTQEESSIHEASEETARVVYWGDTGTKIHTNPNCRTLKNNVHSGSEEEAIAAGRTEGYCKVC